MGKAITVLYTVFVFIKANFNSTYNLLIFNRLLKTVDLKKTVKKTPIDPINNKKSKKQ